MSFSKFAPFVSKVTSEVGRNFLAPPDSNAAKLRNECFSLFMLASLYKAMSLPGEAKRWKIFGT